MEKVYKTSSASETQKLGETFAKTLQRGDFLALYGNLGAGKTTFVQGLAKGLGVANRIISPTFVIIRSYGLGIMNSGSESKFYHVDLYRLRGEEDIEATGLLEIIQEQQSILAVEWPEKLKSLLPKKRYDITFSSVKEDERSITIIQRQE